MLLIFSIICVERWDSGLFAGMKMPFVDTVASEVPMGMLPSVAMSG